MIKILIILFLTIFISQAKECSPYYNPEKYYEAPELLVEFIEETLSQDKLFIKHTPLMSKDFKRINNEYIKDKSYTQHGDYIYPIKTGLWKFKTKNGYLNELNISRSEIYRFKDEEIANSINDDFDNYWMDFTEDGYQMQLTPEQTLFRYNHEYFTFSVFIYGVDGDATPLKGTSVNFWFKNYTNEVNEFIQCKRQENGSR